MNDGSFDELRVDINGKVSFDFIRFDIRSDVAELYAVDVMIMMLRVHC